MSGGMVILVVAFVLYFLVVLKPRGLLNANAVFIYLQMVMGIGSIRVLDKALEADGEYEIVIVLTLLIYMTISGTVLLAGPHPSTTRDAAKSLVVDVKPATWALIALSTLIVVAYFYAVGYSALVSGLQNSFRGANNDVAAQRLDSYSGTRYLFPGYVNQFKNAILPGLVITVLTYWRQTHQRHLLLGAVMVGVTLFGLLGTGQRGAFIQLLGLAAIYMYLFNGNKFPIGSFKIFGLGLGIVIVATVALGRSSSQLGSNAGLIQRVSVAVPEFAGRLFEVQQYSGVAGFRYIYSLPVQWGAEWVRALMGILPGSPGTDLPNQIYATIYGTTRGTAPPSIWGSAYHNFGWFGVVVLPVVLAVAITAVTKASLRARMARTPLELVGIAGVSTCLGFWVSGGPESLLNSGILAYACLWWWGSRQRRGTLPDQFDRDQIEPALARQRVARPRQRVDVASRSR